MSTPENRVAPPVVRRRRGVPSRGAAVAATGPVAAGGGGPGTDPIVRSLFAPAPGSIYLDTATYGLPPRPTVEVMERALRAWQSGQANWIEDWDRPSDRCRADFASLIGTAASTIAYIPAASVGAGVVATSIRAGDEVVVPIDEFTSTLYPLLVAAARGAVIREVRFEDLADAIRPGTRLVAFSLVQMQTGKTADLAAICARARENGAEVFVDATQAVPFVPIADLLPSIDYLVCAGYKHLLSPRGTGYFYVRSDRWLVLEATNANWRAADQPFDRYFGGPLSLAASAARFDVSRAWHPWLGASESLRLLASWKDSDLFPAVRRLADRLADGVGMPRPGSSLVCVPAGDTARAREALTRAGIKASVRGDSVRFAPHVYNTEADIDRAIEVMQPFL
ncbi:MAG: aminotransferase class V-fold PLP-dependent enzyme [Chloroflexi bacterium]|nr:aminotransferase class V-fold PLP-dependent enzyme [Chloroflexota bacterium]